MNFGFFSKNSLKQNWSYIRPLVALVLIWYLISRIPTSRLDKIFLEINGSWLLAGGFIFLIGILISSLKLRLLLRLHSNQISFFKVVKAYYIGVFFNNFLPTSLGGDIMKIKKLKNRNLTLKETGSATIVERGTGLLAVIFLAFSFACFWPSLFQKLKLNSIRVPIIGIVLLGTVGLFFIYWFWKKKATPFLQKKEEKSIYRRVFQVLKSFYVFRGRPKIMIAALAISFLYHGFRALTLVVITAAIGSNLSFSLALGVIPIITFVSLLPISIGALGLREGAIVYSLSHLGLAPEEALSVALLQRLITYVHSGIGGIIYAKYK